LRRLDHENIDSDTLFLKRPALRLAFLLVIAAAAFAATAGSAAATKSCGNKVIDDWYGSKTGQLSTIYPLHCYSDALKLIQGRSDIDIYSNARQDILLAMQQAIAAGKGDGGLGPPDLMTADVYPSFLGGPDAKYGGHAPPGDQPLTIRPRTINNPGPISKIFQGSSASSVPLPAIVLGAIAALLLALGLTAYLARRRQLRRQTFRPQAESGPRNP
jgi:hypothetical protein